MGPQLVLHGVRKQRFHSWFVAQASREHSTLCRVESRELLVTPGRGLQLDCRVVLQAPPRSRVYDVMQWCALPKGRPPLPLIHVDWLQGRLFCCWNESFNPELRGRVRAVPLLDEAVTRATISSRLLWQAGVVSLTLTTTHGLVRRTEHISAPEVPQWRGIFPALGCDVPQLTEPVAVTFSAIKTMLQNDPCESGPATDGWF